MWMDSPCPRLLPTPADATRCESSRGRRLQTVARQLRRAERRRVTAAHRSRLVLALALASWQRRQGQRLLGSRNRGRGQGPHPPTRPDCAEGGHRGILEIESASSDTRILPHSASAPALRRVPPLLADHISATAACAVGVSTVQTTRRTHAVTTFHEPCGCWVGTGGRRPRGAPQRQGGQHRGVG